MLRRIPLGETWNLRDLGGYPTAGGCATVWERMLRSDNPLGLSGADERWLLERNITTVLDLRSEGELERRPLGIVPALLTFPVRWRGASGCPAGKPMWDGAILRHWIEKRVFERSCRWLPMRPEGYCFTARPEKIGRD